MASAGAAGRSPETPSFPTSGHSRAMPRNSSQPRSCRRSQFVSSPQKQYLMGLLDDYPKLRGSVQFNPTMRQVWTDATVELNALPGAKKSTSKWRRTLHDLLYRETRKKKKKTKAFTSELQELQDEIYLFAQRYDEKKVINSMVKKEYSHALLHGADPNLSDTASWAESPSQYDMFSSWTSSEEDETDENVRACDEGVELEQMAAIACPYDDICAHADSVTPASLLEEIVMYGMNQREIVA